MHGGKVTGISLSKGKWIMRHLSSLKSCLYSGKASIKEEWWHRLKTGGFFRIMSWLPRTIGYLNLGNEGNEVGIEGSFDKELAGRNGVAVKQRLTGGDWITVENTNSVESVDGNDVVTTLDIDLQDVASTALAEPAAEA